MAAVTKSNDGNKAMADADLPNEGDETAPKGKEPGSNRGEPREIRSDQPRKSSAGGFFTIYKKGQGYWTRMGTVISAAFLGVMVSYEIYRQLPTFMHGESHHDNHIAIVVALLFLIGYSLLAYWLTNKPTSVDFLVATDSEMKKVNWTTRAELIGSTRVVILFMFLIAFYLFSCDLLFGGFFHLIGVLKTWF